MTPPLSDEVPANRCFSALSQRNTRKRSSVHHTLRLLSVVSTTIISDSEVLLLHSMTMILFNIIVSFHALIGYSLLIRRFQFTEYHLLKRRSAIIVGRAVARVPELIFSCIYLVEAMYFTDFYSCDDASCRIRHENTCSPFAIWLTSFLRWK